MIVGIDLGTTNSLIAVWQDGVARLIPNMLGEFLTPSCVSLDEDGSILVGRAARERLQTHPERTAAVFKRHMGSDKVVHLGKRAFRAEELSALVLKALKADAEAYLGAPVTEAVITVPAYFSDAQRKATRAAGQLAGLKVDRLLNEPTAAALAYGMHQQGNESRFLVFDLGGGTFDVSILELFEGVMEVRASAGDNYLGGEDFVLTMMELFFERTGLPAKLKNDPHFMQRLTAQAESAKRVLSAAPTATMRMRHDEKDHLLEIDEELLEKVCAHLLKRLRDPVERALRDANLRSSELDSIVLAGGATRMPVVKRLVTRMFGRFPASDINPDEVVALGAAVQAGLKMKDAALKEVVMTDVSPYSLGIEISMPSEYGETSVITTSLRAASFIFRPACTAAPRATTSSGLMSLAGKRPNMRVTRRLTTGMRVAPPASTMLSSSLLRRLASRRARSTGSRRRLSRWAQTFSSSSSSISSRWSFSSWRIRIVAVGAALSTRLADSAWAVRRCMKCGSFLSLAGRPVRSKNSSIMVSTKSSPPR